MGAHKPTIGILGAGKVGIVLAQLFIKAGYTVAIAGSGDPSKISLTVSVLVPGATVDTKENVSNQSDVVILALPLGKYRSIPKNELSGKLVIDAMNYWWEVDGDRPEFTQKELSTSELVQQYLDKSRVVKAFSHIGYHELLDEHRPKGTPNRTAIAVAGNTPDDISIVAELVNDIGFDPVYIGSLATTMALQPHGVAFGVHVSANELKKLLNL